jgi:uncharacterized protein (DUF1778 family)
MPARATRPHAQKRERLEARITPEQKTLLEQAAALTGQSLTDFVVGSAQRAAEQTIREHEVMRLSEEDSRAFVAALLNPPDPTPELRAAVERYRQSVQDRLL